MRFRFIDAAKKDLPARRLCKVLGVRLSKYFALKGRPAYWRRRDDMVMLAHVRSAFVCSSRTCGSPRMMHELRVVCRGDQHVCGQRYRGPPPPMGLMQIMEIVE